MDFLAILLTLLCYGLAGYFWWQYKTPVYVVILLSGHVAALASPLWSLLYGVAYRSDLAIMTTLFDRPLFRTLFIASAWFYTLPALLVFYLYQTRWWFPGYITGLLTYAAFMLYHLLIEALGLRANLWSYSNTTALPFISSPFLSALMAALISLALLYVLLITYRYALPSMLVTLLPATLAISLLIHGLLGAPLWIALLLEAQSWTISIGMISTLALLGWAIHILTHGLTQADQGLTV
jgi:hypothetical protein